MTRLNGHIDFTGSSCNLQGFSSPQLVLVSLTDMQDGADEASASAQPQQRRARIVGELPPLPRASSSRINGHNDNNEDDEEDDEGAADGSDKDDESDFDEPVKTEGGLSDKIAARLDERQYEDDKRLAQGVPEAQEDDDSGESIPRKICL